MSKPALTCGKCYEGWICDEHPGQPAGHDGCSEPNNPCADVSLPHRPTSSSDNKASLSTLS
jgi:hypothetical protein